MTSKGLIAILATTAVALAIALPAASGASRASVVNVTAGKPSELRFTLSKKSAAKGVVTFKVTNRGYARARLQHRRKGDQEAEARHERDAQGHVQKGGRFPYLCTVPGHAAAGMKGVFVVK